jgi:hypothetical protein
MYKTVQSSGKKELRKRFTVGSCQMPRKKRAKDVVLDARASGAPGPAEPK